MKNYESITDEKRLAKIDKYTRENANYKPLAFGRKRTSNPRNPSVKFIKIAATVLFIVISAHFLCRSKAVWNINHTTLSVQDAVELIKITPSSEHIRDFFHYYAAKTHLAGTENDKEQALWTQAKFIEFGIEDTTIETYYPVLNYPSQRRLAIVEGASELLYEATLQEQDPFKDSVPTFHGYSASGNVTGPLVYVNYGRLADFQFLASQGVSLTGTIALMRHGAISRGIKIKTAEAFGCIGALLYSDPIDDGPFNKTGKDDQPAASYPAGPWRSSLSVERGTVHDLSQMPGDPFTPGYAATENATRVAWNETTAIPHIPSLPISWADALPLFKALQSYGVPLTGSWQGGMPDVDYFSGPSEAIVNLVNQNNYTVTPIWNVIGRIPGAEEPNRAIIIGNHRDAWSFGGADAASGSAIMLELVRVFGVMLQQGWRPRRTIVIASWDAEEYGTVGSTEWVEDHKAWLQDEAVAYINVDIGVTGPHFDAQASPLLNQLLYKVTNEIIDPLTSKTVFEAWRDRFKSESVHVSNDDLPKPLVRPLGAGSDYVGFMSFAGVSSASLSFRGDYGVYHSDFDNIHWMETFGDPTFEYHRTMACIWGLMTVKLSSDMLLPMTPLDYGNELVRYASHLSNQQGCLALPDLTLAVTTLQQKCYAFDKKLKKYEHKLQKHKHYSNKLLKYVDKSNDRLAQFERAFIDPEGLPNRPWYKHVVYAPAVWSGYHSQFFPAIVEAMESNNPSLTRQAEESTAKFVSSALSVLRGKYDDFMDDDLV